MCKTYPCQTFPERELSKFACSFLHFSFDIRCDSFIQPPSRLVHHPFVSSCRSPSTTNPRAHREHLASPVLSAASRCGELIIILPCPTRVWCGILPQTGSMFFKVNFPLARFLSLSVSMCLLQSLNFSLLRSLSLGFSCSVHCISLGFTFFFL